MKVGFAVVIRNEKLDLQFFGHAPGKKRSLVSHAQHGRQHAVLMGRLTYRSELVKGLSPEYASPSVSDAALALAAYRQRGPTGLADLEGCFAVVIWDADNQRLLGSRDSLGGYPLFWAKFSEGMAFSTCLRPLRQLLQSSSLNLNYLAEYFAFPNCFYVEPATPHCAYDGIHRVAPGAVTSATPSDRRCREEKHWDWFDRIGDPGTDRLEELAELAGTGLRCAVGEQLRGVVAAHFSGGMDSTSVALLARDHLRHWPGQPPVHAISLVWKELGGLSRETPYLDEALKQPGIIGHRMPADEILDFDCFADPPVHDEPFGALDRCGLMAKMVDTAAQVGADTLLTGIGGDGMFDQQPYYAADLVGRGRLLSAWRSAAACGRAYNRSAWRMLWEFGMKPWLPAALQGGWRALWRGGHTDWERQGPGTIAPWIRRDFARAFALRDRTVEQIKAPCRSRHLGAILEMLPGMAGDPVRWNDAAPRGIAYMHPFQDARFVCLCLGIQRRFRQQPGTQKPLLAHAMRDVLPEAIRNRRIKGHYNSVQHAGLARNLPLLEALVRDTRIDELGVFDKKVLLDCLRKMSLGHAPGCGMDSMRKTLSWLLWYSRQEEWQIPLMPVLTISDDVRRQPALAVYRGLAVSESPPRPQQTSGQAAEGTM